MSFFKNVNLRRTLLLYDQPNFSKNIVEGQHLNYLLFCWRATYKLSVIFPIINHHFIHCLPLIISSLLWLLTSHLRSTRYNPQFHDTVMQTWQFVLYSQVSFLVSFSPIICKMSTSSENVKRMFFLSIFRKSHSKCNKRLLPWFQNQIQSKYGFWLVKCVILFKSLNYYHYVCNYIRTSS